MNPPRERRLARIVQVLFRVPVFRQISLRVKPANGLAADGGEAGLAVLIQIYAAGGTDGLFRGLFERSGERGLRPAPLRLGWMTVFKNLADGAFYEVTILTFVRLRLRGRFRLICHGGPVLN